MSRKPSQPAQFIMLPPPADHCQICGEKHPEEQPHNAQSLYYKTWFYSTYGRSITWADAMLHCSEETRTMWEIHFKKIGVDINSPNLTGGIKSQGELEHRLEK
jgi:hypothetical protein